MLAPMYTAFFGLKQDPFSISPDPRFLFMSERHRDALAHLLFGVEGAGGIVLLTGDIGTGKTSISRRFLEQAPARCQVAYIFNPRLNVIELLQSVCDEFGVAVPGDREPTVKQLIDPLNAFLLAAHAAGRNPILIIDEAQNLSTEVLEQLRLLTNLETDERKLLQIVLIGQPELRHLLASPSLEQLAQRVVARFHLGALDERDTGLYIAHRLAVAGLSGPVPFTPRALQRVHRLAGGVPRRINLLCGRSLLGAYSLGQRTVSPAVVSRAAQEVFGPLDAARRPGSPGRLGLLALGLASGAALTAGAFWLVRDPAHGGTPVEVAAATRSAASASADTGRAQSVSTAPALPPPAAAPSAPLSAVGEMKAGMLLASEREGLLAIGPLWQLVAEGPALCAQALRQRLQCYRTPRMTLNGLRQMDSPAVLRVHLPDGSGYAVLDGLDDQRVALRAGARRWVLPVAAMNTIWRGEYLSLWRTPPGQAGHLSNGFRGPAAAWMAQRLDALQRQGGLPASATGLRDRVEAFQRSRGIDVNGRASPTTLILLKRATDADEPRLSAITP